MSIRGAVQLNIEDDMRYDEICGAGDLAFMNYWIAIFISQVCPSAAKERLRSSLLSGANRELHLPNIFLWNSRIIRNGVVHLSLWLLFMLGSLAETADVSGIHYS